MLKKHSSFKLEEPGLSVSLEHPWLAASLDGIRTRSCCEDALVECKCPFNGKDMDPKTAFLLDSVGWIQTKDGKQQLHQNHLHYFQVHTGMAGAGLKKSDFVIYTSKGIHVVEIPFNNKYGESVVAKVKSFYIHQIIPSCSMTKETSSAHSSPVMTNPVHDQTPSHSADTIFQQKKRRLSLKSSHLHHTTPKPTAPHKKFVLELHLRVSQYLRVSKKMRLEVMILTQATLTYVNLLTLPRLRKQYLHIKILLTMAVVTQSSSIQDL